MTIIECDDKDCEHYCNGICDMVRLSVFMEVVSTERNDEVLITRCSYDSPYYEDMSKAIQKEEHMSKMENLLGVLLKNDSTNQINDDVKIVIQREFMNMWENLKKI